MLNDIDKKRIIRKLNQHSVKEECWLWIGAKQGGYGRISVGKKKYLTHVLSAWIYLRIYPDPKNYICHTRECKNKNCWNPQHLYNGTCKSNIQDSIALGTHHLASKTQCPRGHDLDSIFWDRERINPHRYCRICRVDRVSAWRARRKAEGKSAK